MGEFVCPREEPPNGFLILTGLSWDYVCTGNIIWTEKVVFMYVGMYVCVIFHVCIFMPKGKIVNWLKIISTDRNLIKKLRK